MLLLPHINAWLSQNFGLRRRINVSFFHFHEMHRSLFHFNNSKTSIRVDSSWAWLVLNSGHMEDSNFVNRRCCNLFDYFPEEQTRGKLGILRIPLWAPNNLSPTKKRSFLRRCLGAVTSKANCDEKACPTVSLCYQTLWERYAQSLDHVELCLMRHVCVCVFRKCEGCTKRKLIISVLILLVRRSYAEWSN